MGFWKSFRKYIGIDSLTGKKARVKARNDERKAAGVLLNQESADWPIPVIYGERRVGGTRVFVSTRDVAGGDVNEFLYICLVLCEGEVESITLPIIGDTPYPNARFDYTDSVAYNIHLGTDSDTVDTLLQGAGPQWTSNHRLRGVAYVAIRLKYNKDAFSGIPEITWLVAGKRVLDPRTSTTAYSINPALCIRDYLTNARYGKGLSASEIDTAAFNTAADDCDVFAAALYTGGPTGAIFTTNVVLDTEEELFANLQTMLAGCRGFLPYIQGKYALKIDKSSSSVFAFTTRHIIGGLQISGESKADKSNRYIVTFNDATTDWQNNIAIWPDAGSAEEIAFLEADNGVVLSKEIGLETITSYYVAREFARVFVLRSRNAIRASFVATSEAIELTVGDVVTITHTTPGWDAKPFQVEEIGLSDDGTCAIQVIEYDSSIYTYDPGAIQTVYPDTNLPNIFTVLTPTTLVFAQSSRLGSDGITQSIVTVSWTQPADAFVHQWELQFKIAADPDYLSVIVAQSRYEAAGAAVGVLHDVRVRAITTAGVRSAWLVGTYTPTLTATVNGVTIGDIQEQAASVTTKLDKAGGDILTGIVDIQMTTNYNAALRAGDVVWNTTTGAWVSGSGVIMSRKGIVAYADAATPTFTLDAVTGAAAFKGEVVATTLISETYTQGKVLAITPTAGVYTVDWNLAEVFTMTITADCDFNFINAPTAASMASRIIYLIVTNGGNYTITYTATEVIKTANGAPVVLTTNGQDYLMVATNTTDSLLVVPIYNILAV